VKKAEAHAAITLLVELFPRTFFVHEAKRRPLKIGIAADLIARINGAIRPHELTGALAAYTRNAGYLRSMRTGAARVGLDGTPAGAVTAEEAARAAEQLGTKLLRNAARKKAKPVPAPVPTAAGPRRVTLTDLKQLAVLRRQAG
jgi:ProP effector